MAPPDKCGYRTIWLRCSRRGAARKVQLRGGRRSTGSTSFHLLDTDLRCSPKRDAAIPIALQMSRPAGTGAAVRDAVREAGICKRHFIQLFRGEVGVTPKRFCRLLRFQRARVLAERYESIRSDRADRTLVPPALDWADLAVTCGYSDRSHLINDREEFSGLRPTQVRSTTSAGFRLKENHVPMPR